MPGSPDRPSEGHRERPMLPPGLSVVEIQPVVLLALNLNPLTALCNIRSVSFKLPAHSRRGTDPGVSSSL